MADHIVQPNVFAYSACISAYEKMGRWKEPLELPLGSFLDCTRCLTLWIGKGCLFCVGVDFLRSDVNGNETNGSFPKRVGFRLFSVRMLNA